MLAFLLSATVWATTWQQPAEEVMEVLHAPQNPVSWMSPTTDSALFARRVRYPPLADKASEMLPLAGIRVDGKTNGFHGSRTYEDLQIFHMEDGVQTPLDLGGHRMLGMVWSADGNRLAISVKKSNHIGLWVGTRTGEGRFVEGLELNPLLGEAMQWHPDQTRLVVLRVPSNRGEVPTSPEIPTGPATREGDGGTAISTYEARDLLQTAHDDALFSHYATSEIAIVDADSLSVRSLGGPRVYANAKASPDGKYLLVETLKGPWSHRHAWWRFAHDIEVWNMDGERVHRVAQNPLADSVPIHGVATGPRRMGWRNNAKATLVWVEAQDGGDWSVKVPYRDHLVMQKAPFRRAPKTVFKSEHRVSSLRWGEEKSLLLVDQYERSRRWRHVWKVNVDKKQSSPWFDLSRNDRYADPGWPLMQVQANGYWVLRQEGDDLFFAGRGASPQGDRPFLDRRSLGKKMDVVRLFRSEPGHYESFQTFMGKGHDTLLIRSQSESKPPNLYKIQLGAPKVAENGEAVFDATRTPITDFVDPSPVLRDIERRIVTYKRADGVPLSFNLYLPPGYKEGTPLPTVVHAYPREFSDAKTAGQVRGSKHEFTRVAGTSPLFFLLQGYAVLHNTRMPVIGDPDTAYDSFVEQLVSGAEAAVKEAVRLGVTDPERVGVMGHSHGGLMTVTLLAHSDLFKAGIARSGAYNHTIRPFGFQSERRTLWQATDTYLQLSPVMHAPKINEPLLLIHGAIDENPGTIAFQSERLFEAVRGVGGTVRWVSLPHEGHGYRARESVEHVLWEQFQWFDRHVKGANPAVENAQEAP